MSENDHAVAESHIDLYERVRRRAHEIYLARQRSGREGTDLDDWLAAEADVLGANPKDPAQNRANTVGDAHAPDLKRIEGYGEA
jgi:hypothetical protein